MSDHSELKRLAEASTPGRIHDRLDSCGGGLKYTCAGDDGSLVLSVDHKDDTLGFVGPNCEADEAFFLKCTPAVVLALIAEVEQLKADLQGELNSAKEDARRQRADQIAYRAAVYRIKREAPGEVVGGARFQRLFLISNDNAQILLSAMKERGDLVEIKEKPWGGMVPSTNSEILGEQP